VVEVKLELEEEGVDALDVVVVEELEVDVVEEEVV